MLSKGPGRVPNILLDYFLPSLLHPASDFGSSPENWEPVDNMAEGLWKYFHQRDNN